MVTKKLASGLIPRPAPFAIIKNETACMGCIACFVIAPEWLRTCLELQMFIDCVIFNCCLFVPTDS